MTEFKICGLREPNNTLTAARAGASLLGFNFVEGVRRRLSPERGRNVIQQFRSESNAATPELVGLFANQTVDFVRSTVRLCGLDAVQLCGDEPPEFWSAVDCPVIKQVRVRVGADRSMEIERVLCAVRAVVDDGHRAQLDTQESGSLGGTGISFDWTIAAEITSEFDVMLAGGLTPENVGRAIFVTRPWAVDVSSGVETDGVKDDSKIVSFGEQVRLADQQSNPEK